MSESERKSSTTKKRVGTSSADNLDDELSTKLTLNRSSDVSKSTGAVAKQYKIRHPTDPLPSSLSETKQRSPRASGNKKTLSWSDSHLVSGTPQHHSTGSSPTSTGSLYSGRRKSPSVSGLGPMPNLHVHITGSQSGLSGGVLQDRHDGGLQDGDSRGQVHHRATTPDSIRSGSKNLSDSLNNGRGPYGGGKLAKGQRTPKKEPAKNFENYMLLNDVQQGLKKGELLEGILRINPKNFQEAYISVPGERTDMFLGGILDRNRALNGDLVAVQLKPKQEWKILISDLRSFLIRCNFAFITKTHHTEHQQKPKSLLTAIGRDRKSKQPEVKVQDTENVLIKAKKPCRRRKRGRKRKTNLDSSIKEQQNQENVVKNDCEINSKNMHCPGGDAAVQENVVNVEILDEDAATKFAKIRQNLQVSDEVNDSPLINLENDVPYISSSVPDSLLCSNDVVTNNDDKNNTFSNDSNCSSGLIFPVVDEFVLYDSTNVLNVSSNTGMSAKVDNWETAAKSSEVAIVQLEDLFMTEQSMSVADQEATGVANYESDGDDQPQFPGVVVPPDELSEDDLASGSDNNSTCSDELQCVVEDAQFFNDNFRSSFAASAASGSNFESFESGNDNVELQGAVAAGVPAEVANEEIDSPDTVVALENVYYPGDRPKGVIGTANEICDGASGDEAHIGCDRELLSDFLKLLSVKPLEDLTVDDLLPNWSQFVQRTAKVVYILEEKHNRMARGHLKLMQDKNPKWALFSPVDHKLPRMMILMDQCPSDFVVRHQIYADVMFVARITEWTDACYAKGSLCKQLGIIGDLEAETEGILLEHGVNCDDFPSEALWGLPTVPWSIPEDELSYRRDFRNECVFTIDPATARDLDDAVSCVCLGDGLYRVGVHIADVSYFVKEGTPLDSIAGNRSTSVYLVQKVIPMLPRILCEQLCSLNPGEDRLSFSVEWKIDQDGRILSEWFGRTVINSCSKLSYDHAQLIIDNPEKLEYGEGEMPQIHGGWKIGDIRQRVLALHRIAVNLRKKRADKGSLRLDQIKLQFHLTDGIPNGYSAYVQRDSNRLIEEFMLLANMAVAHKIQKAFPKLAVLRCHVPPKEKGMDEVHAMLQGFGIHLDITTSGSLQQSLLRYTGTDKYSLARQQIIVLMLAKPMNRATYFCSGTIADESAYWHYALNVPLYTHFTSPIRRYPDILVHRLLAASLNYPQLLPYNSKKLSQLAAIANDKKSKAKEVQELSNELFLGAFIKKVGSISEEAMVCNVMDRSFDVYILKLGAVKRIYCEQIPGATVKFSDEGGIPLLFLTITPSADLKTEQAPRAAFNVMITIFTMVNVNLISTKDNPLKFNAYLNLPNLEETKRGDLFPLNEDNEQENETELQ